MSKLWFAMVAVAGCHGAPASPIDTPPPTTIAPAEPSDGARSGARLKLALWQSGDGFTSWTGRFFDAQLGTYCWVAPWSDGHSYCTPNASSFEQPGWFGDVGYDPVAATDASSAVYADDQCTQPVMIASAAPLSYAVAWVDDGCSVDPLSRSRKVDHLYRRGAQIPMPDARFQYDPLDRICTTLGQDVSHDTAYALEEVPARLELVAISQRTAPATDRLSTTYLVSDDGMQFPVHAHDTQFDADCYFTSPLGGPQTCVPVGAVSSVFGGAGGLDASCTRPLATVPVRCPRPSAMFDTSTAPADFDPTKFFPVGAPTIQLCPQTPPVADTSYYQLGAATPLATASIARENITGRRLELYHRVVDSWTGRDTGHLHDNYYDLDCRLRADGVTSAYCSVYPTCGSVNTQTYLDPGCGLKLTRFDHTGCTTPPPPVVDRYAILTDQKQEVTVYDIFNTGPGRSECKPVGVRTLYMVAPDLVPLDRFEQFTAAVDSE